MQSTSILAYGATLVANAKDAVFSAIVGAAVSQIAVMNYWGEAAVDGRKSQTLTTVQDGQRKAFNIAKGKTQANDWLAVATLIRKRIEKDCADTLAIAKVMDTPQACFATILNDVKGQMSGENTIEALRAWGSLGKVAKVAATKSVGEKILTLCDKVTELIYEEAKRIIGAISAMMHNRVRVEQGAIDRKAAQEATAKAVIAKAKRATAKAAKLAKASFALGITLHRANQPCVPPARRAFACPKQI